MSAWRSGAGGRPPDVILIQGTHVISVEEGTELNELWNSCWGLPDPERVSSVWSVSTGKAGGVGILISPRTAEALRTTESLLTYRFITVETKLGVIANVYAPNIPRERDAFFKDVRAATSTAGQDMILSSDYNCVQNTQRGRLSRAEQPRQGSEYQALDRLQEDWDLHDVVDVLLNHDDNDTRAPSDHFTYWRHD